MAFLKFPRCFPLLPSLVVYTSNCTSKKIIRLFAHAFIFSRTTRCSAHAFIESRCYVEPMSGLHTMVDLFPKT